MAVPRKLPRKVRLSYILGGTATHTELLLLSRVLEITDQQQLLLVVAVAILAWAVHSSGYFPWTDLTILKAVRGGWWKGPLLAVLLVLGLRGALQPAFGTPQPEVHDEFSYLLMGDTFAHLRLTNPTPPAWQHFETFHVNLVPSYQSKYWPGQGIILAAGELLFHQPWVGIYLTTALMAGVICWALAAFVSPAWAFTGAMLCALRLCIVGYWMNSYWGGSLAALGGALCLGATARLVQPERRNRIALGFALGLGFCILGFTRPFEGALFSLPLVIWMALHTLRRKTAENRAERWHALAVAASVVAVALAFLAYYNFRVTGSATLSPYSLYESKYNFLPLFFWGTPHPAPHYANPDIATFYKGWEYDFYHVMQTWHGFLYSESTRRMQLGRFFVGPVLSIPLAAGIVISVTSARLRIIFWCGLATFIAYSLPIFYQPHYFAPATVVVFGSIVIGLQWLWTSRSVLLRCLAGSLCVVALIFAPLDSFHSRYYEFPRGTDRQLIAEWVSGVPGKHLILVNYSGKHELRHELVFNGADFPSERILWARGMGATRDMELCGPFADRHFWALDTDDYFFRVSPSTLCDHSPPHQK